MSRPLHLIAFAAGLAAATASGQTPAPAPPPYSLPWLLRPATPGTVLRLDSTLAVFEDAAGRAGSTFVESLTASYRLSPRLGAVGRVSLVHHSPPGPLSSGGGVSNPLLGVQWARPLARAFRLSLFAATTLPVGSGGGSDPDPSAARAMAGAVPARSAMDNALFAVNYWTVLGGLGLARVTQGLTVQAEANLLRLTRVRGPRTQDSARTNLTFGLHAGRLFGRRLSLGAELRGQRWLSEAAPVRADRRARETFTFALGPRLHLRAGRRWIRPGFTWARALDAPLSSSGYDMFQVDVPIAF